MRAFENLEALEDIWRCGGRYYDAFRPTIEPDGFASAEELLASRRSHLCAVKRVFLESEVFIFTLGLTEAWRSSLDGMVYPLCPGTTAGDFDSTRHEFHNFSHSEILSDLSSLITKARAVNPGLKFLLTVSPVPLTATASDQHVMVASSYSKSVLRAVAGELEASDPSIDYFPSYELVTAPPVRAALFDPNLRTVTDRGVDFVMSHFFAEHGEGVGESKDPTATTHTPAPAPRHMDDVICEEEMLERFAR